MGSIRKLFTKLLFNRNNHARFKLILRNWGGISDVNILTEALQTETFRSYVKHSVCTPKKGDRILVLAPHQDDELIGAGGLMLSAKEVGAHLSICFVTNGAQNNLVLNGEKKTPQNIAEIRKKEAINVCEKLGADFYELNIDNVKMDVSHDHISGLAEIITSSEPEIILSPWIFDGSAKHRAVNQMLFHALNGLPEKYSCDIWGYQVNNPIFSNIIVNITDQMVEKNKLIEIYTSQNMGIKNYAHLAEGLSAWNSRYLPSKTAEGKKEYAEIFMAMHAQEFQQLIKNYYLNNLEEVYFGDMDLVKKMQRFN